MMEWFLGSLTNEQWESLVQLVTQAQQQDKDAPFLNHQNVLENIQLAWFQCFAVEHALISKSTLISLDTGLGKTATAVGFLTKLHEQHPNKKFLYICLPSSVDQAWEDFTSYTSKLRVEVVTGETSSIQYIRRLNTDNYDGIILSYKALYSIELCNFLVQHLDEYIGVVVDEAHEITQASLINSTCTALLARIEYRLALTATPITVSPEQGVILMNMLDPLVFPEGVDVLRPYRILHPETFELIDYKDLDNWCSRLYPHLVSWTREELGLKGNYIPVPLLVKPTDEEQLNCKLLDIPTVLKGRMDTNQTKTILAIIKDMTAMGKCGLVYASRVANIEMLNRLFLDNGFRSDTAYGDPSSVKRRPQVLKSLRNRELDVLVTDLTTSLNMDSDYVVFWENTNRAQQMLGRCVRGFKVKDLYIFYILTDETVELLQFEKNVYRRTKWLGQTFGKDVKVFEDIHQAIERYKKAHPELLIPC